MCVLLFIKKIMNFEQIFSKLELKNLLKKSKNGNFSPKNGEKISFK